MEKITKQDLKRPDLFLYESAKVADWIYKHKKTFTITVLTLAMAGVLWAVYGSYTENIEQKAQTDLYQAEKTLKTVEAPAKDKKPATEQDYKPALDQLKSVVEKYPSSQAATFAALNYSRINFGFKKYDDNIALLEKVKSKARFAVPKALTYNSLAINYVAKGNCDAAINQWNQIEGNDDMTFFHGDVLVNKALCYEKQGKIELAQQMLKKAESQTKNPEVAKTAKKYLRLMK